MNYKQALDYIHGTYKFGSKLGLDNIRVLLELLGNPQKKLKIIHVAGTNGKGSTSSFITSMLSEEGYRVGLFTSPYLETFTERIRIGNELIPENRLAEITEEVKNKVDEMLNLQYNHPTEFEIVTAIAFKYYYEEKVDFVVLEVGLGGRFDSTNIIDKPLASVFTPISYDHMNILGDTLDKIAWEKAGIIKENCLAISGQQQKEAEDVIRSVANEKKCEFIMVPNQNINITKIDETGAVFDYYYENFNKKGLQLKLLGKHQVYNASLALTVLIKLRENQVLRVSDKSLVKGLEKTRWKGRLEIVRNKPLFVIDGAHNIQGVDSLIQNIKRIFKYNKLILGIGLLGDKDVEKIVSKLVPLADNIVVTKPLSPRALKAQELAEIIKQYNRNCIVKENIKKAINEAVRISNEGDLIVFSGSLYLIGEVRKIVVSESK